MVVGCRWQVRRVARQWRPGRWPRQGCWWHQSTQVHQSLAVGPATDPWKNQPSSSTLEPISQRATAAGEAQTRTDPARNRAPQRSDAEPVPDDEHDVVKLDNHAREPQIVESARTGEGAEPKGTRWDPLERYKFRAHSSPDYGTEGEGMGPSRLRAINGSAGPVNTLASPLYSSNVYFVNDSPPPKRQKPDGSRVHRTLTSPYFSTPKPAAHKDVLDLTRSISRDDQYDLESDPSTGKSTSDAPPNVSELRNARQTADSHLGRMRRKRRVSCRPDNIAGALTPKVSGLAAKTPGRGSRSDAVGSPDALANDEKPPPAEIVSDVQSKRMLYLCHSESIGPPIKRAKQTQPPRESIETSEDELTAEPGKTERKKKTNFSGLDQPRQQVKARGDIQPTMFGDLRQLLEPSPPTYPGMVLKMAACGKNLYESGQGRHQVILCPESTNSFKLVPTTTSGELLLQLAWLNIDTKAAFRVQHAATSSPCVVVSRSKTVNFEGKLALEFNNPQSASRLVSMIDGDKAEEKPKAEVEAIVHKAVQDATSYSAANARAREDARQQLAENKHAETPWVANRTTVAVVGEKGSRSKILLNELPRSARTDGAHPVDLSGDTEMPLRCHAPDTRRTRRSLPSPIRREPSPDRWTTKHPDWRKRWQRSLIFPVTGKNRATVDDEDIPRLDEGEFLNDNLISFYLRYLQAKLENERPELLEKVYIFSSFFFEKLRSTKGKINYDGVKAWTAKFDLFSYDYIMVPVNEHAHWYLVIICNVQNALNGVSAIEDEDVVDVSSEHRDVEILSSPPSTSTRRMPATSPGTQIKTSPTGSGAQKFDRRHPRIVTLDSLDSPHSPTCKALREYLVEEAKNKKGVDLALIPNGMTAKKIPHQNNFCDCGVFVLGYTEEFLRDPDEVARKLLHKESPEWDIQPSELRNKVRSLLFDLQKEQQDRLEKEKENREKEEKRKAAAKTNAGKNEQLQSSRLAEASSTSPKASPEEGDSAAENVKASSASGGGSREQHQGTGSREGSPMQQDRSPERNPQARDGEDLELVSSLNTESTTNTSTPNEVFDSACSSPDGKLPQAADQAVGKLTNDNRPNAVRESVSVDADELHFVRTLPSSSSDASTDNEASKTRELLVKTGKEAMPPPERATARQKTKRHGHFPSSTRHLISIESSPPKGKGASYDGIDRTVDLT
ncbi:Ubiquitin-like-specific protease 2 [Tolypocladium capitatum]|uniref:Ubiquitin-like-specific protease 2 n=1 Tax=Tolypocladium capitatum TaxID=45235 RepID=A0A2K3Q9X2_9HYPO|nr:Ubiquitin-like-specific protease 2 [Tolypocladium capitatum]